MLKNRTEKIGSDQPCFIIAEVGVNHNGDLKLALELVDAAVKAGVDAVKFQTFTADSLVTRSAQMATYQKTNIGSETSQYEMLKELELQENDFLELKQYAERKGLIFISTPFDEQAFQLLENIDLELYKVGSGDLTNLPLIELIAKSQKQMIISTGMANMEEILEAVDVIKKHGGQPIILHCTSNYPTADEEVNLSAMQQIANATNCLVGYSDHTTSLDIPAYAVAMGAKVIEKHITLDKSMNGPDHKASIDPTELQVMVQKIRWIETVMGTGEKVPTSAELETALVARKSLIALQPIKKGDLITESHVGIKRPGSGLKPKYFQDVIGKKAVRDIELEDLLAWEDIE